MMSNRCWPSWTTWPMIPLIWSKTPMPARIVHSTKTMTTPAMPRATESRNEIFIADHGSTRETVSRTRGRMPGARRVGRGGLVLSHGVGVGGGRAGAPRPPGPWASGGLRGGAVHRHGGRRRGADPVSVRAMRGRAGRCPRHDPSRGPPAVPPSAYGRTPGGPSGRTRSDALGDPHCLRCSTHDLLSPRRPTTVRHPSPRLRHADACRHGSRPHRHHRRRRGDPVHRRSPDRRRPLGGGLDRLDGLLDLALGVARHGDDRVVLARLGELHPHGVAAGQAHLVDPATGRCCPSRRSRGPRRRRRR